jgi:4-alpha-glucanotransferase
MHDATVGVPPDAFSDTGQDWGLPVYRWDVMAGEDFAWFRERARRTADLFDGYRVDHLVGLYRTYVRPLDGATPYFMPAEEADQTALGETVLRVFLESGATVIAEDLGTVPDFVRASMRALDIPGFSVLRWERVWKTPGEPFLDPRTYPVTSVATTGTHDTESMAVWWDEAPAELRGAFAGLPLVRERAISTRSGYGPALRDAVLELMLGARSRLVILPLQDVFGWTDRINVPATVGETNWTWRVRWPIDRWGVEPEAAERAAVLSRLSCHHGRTRAEAQARGHAAR